MVIEGFYFPDLAMVVDVADEHRDRLAGWRLNGRLIPGAKPLTFTADRPTRIEAVIEWIVGPADGDCRGFGYGCATTA